MTSDTSFGALIKARRSALGMSQAALAELVGRSASAIRTWERGSSTPTDESVVRSLSAVLGIDEDNLRATVGLPPMGRGEGETVGGATLEDFVGGPGPLGEEVPPDAQMASGGVAVEHGPVRPPADPTDEASGESSEGPKEIEEESEATSETPPEGDPGAVESGAEAAPERSEAEHQPPEPTRSATGENDITVIEPVPAAVAGSRMATTQTVPQPPVPAQRSYLEDPEQMMTYWIRAALTVAFAVFLLVVLFWALGRLSDSLGEVWEIIKAGS